MPNKILLLIITLLLPGGAIAVTPKSGQSDSTWSFATGLGYDDNAFRAPRNTYTDYAAIPIGSNPTVIPNRKSGVFIPFELKADVVKNRAGDTRLLGSASAEGSFYPGGLSNANEYNMRLKGGPEFVLSREGKSENTLYVGAFLGKHKQVYVDHASGLEKTTTTTGTNISNRYNYLSTGFDAKYRHRTGSVDFSFHGQLAENNYDDPVAVSQMDHSYYNLGGDVSLPVVPDVKLELSLGHSARDFSSRHSHDALGVYKSIYPLLKYSYNNAKATLRNRISSDWLLYLDYDRVQRTDGYVGYNDYQENRYGARLLYEQGRIKGRLALHHWGRDYPNGFAFDVAGQDPKTYSGNDLKFKAEMEQSNNSSLWVELEHKVQHTTDLRYDFSRTQVMAGMRWAY